MYASKYYETKCLNTFNGAAAAGAAGLFAGLFLSNPGESGTAGAEMNYAGYARAAVTFGAPFADLSGVSVINGQEVIWPEAAADAGTARYIGIYDSAAPGAGNMWLYAELTTPIVVNAGNRPSVGVGDLTFTLTGTFTAAFKTKLLNLLNGAGVPGFAPYWALFSGDPETGGAELTGDNYERVAVAFTAPAAQVGGQSEIKSAAEARFNRPSAAWGQWEYSALMDARTAGTVVAKGRNPKPEAIYVNHVVWSEAGDIKVDLN